MSRRAATGSGAGGGRVVVVGLGLVGGSLARALKAGEEAPWIGAVSLEPEELSAARREGVVDRVFEDGAEAVAAASLVVYATPVDATLELLGRHREAWAPEAVVTDVVSVKEPILERIRGLGAGSRFVGGHPMAGSERTGFDASRADLFRGARVHLVRGEAAEDAVARVEELWRRVGALPVWVDAAEHDRRMVLVSHLPQLASSALASVLDHRGVEPDELGPGGRGMTRLAASSPALWQGLVEALADADREALGALSDELERLGELLARGDAEGLRRYLTRARAWRRDPGEEGPWS